MRYLIFTILLLSLTSIMNCGSEKSEQSKNESTVFATFEVRYLELEKELRGLATFKAGNTQEKVQNIQIPEVYFQNNAMKPQNLGERGFRYIHTQRGAYHDKFNFRFKNPQSKTSSYEFGMSPPGDFTIREGKVQKSAGITINWTDAPLDNTQSIIFMFTDSLQKTSSTFVKGPTQDSDFFIPARDLTGLTLGTGELYFVKKQLSTYKKKDLEAQSIVEYYTKAINIEVIE